MISTIYKPGILTASLVTRVENFFFLHASSLKSVFCTQFTSKKEFLNSDIFQPSNTTKIKNKFACIGNTITFHF